MSQVQYLCVSHQHAEHVECEENVTDVITINGTIVL